MNGKQIPHSHTNVTHIYYHKFGFVDCGEHLTSKNNIRDSQFLLCLDFKKTLHDEEFFYHSGVTLNLK